MFTKAPRRRSSMRTVLTLAGVTLAVAILIVPASAAAGVYDGSISFKPPVTPPSLVPRLPETQTNSYIDTIAASYDDAGGTLTLRVRLFDPQTRGESLPYMRFQAGDVWGELSTSWTDSAWFKIAGYDGRVEGTVTFDGQTTTVVFQHPALAGLDIHSVTVQRLDEFGEVLNEGHTIWLTSETERRPQKPHAYVAANDMQTVWREKPKLWRIYPNHAPNCCGVTLQGIRWRNWGQPDAYATAKTRFKIYEPWNHVKVHAYGRAVIRHQGDPMPPDGEPAPYTSYRYRYVEVKFPGRQAVRWKLDFPRSEPPS
jgi:hypothetical protein